MRVDHNRHPPHPLAERLPVTGASYDLGAATDTGRRRNNEDHYLIADLDHGLAVRRTSVGSPPHAVTEGGPVGRLLLVVADGVGGHTGGERASAAVIRDVASSVAHAAQATGGTASDLHQRMDAGLRNADRRVRTMPKGDDGHTPATTATAVCVEYPSLMLAHVGDSRCYLFRGGILTQLTHDHTLAAVLRESTTEEVGHNFDHVLVNAIGGQDAAKPDLKRVAVLSGDVLLLCTDGVTDVLDDASIARHLRATGTADELAGALVEAAYEAGSPDNLTAVIARIR